MLATLIAVVGLLLAYANGSNDNFKGVATLLGSGTTSYRRALLLATGATAAGSLVALIVARELLVAFSGKGLVPGPVAAEPTFAAAVAVAAGATVLLASRLGFPISTTHALLGGLVGAGAMLSPDGVHGGQLANGFVLPLLLSPVLALALTATSYPSLRRLRRLSGVTRETCVCVGDRVVAVVPGTLGAAQATRAVAMQMPAASVGTGATCRVRYRGTVWGVSAGRFLDAAHYASAGAVSFARGLNDTPKIAALLLVGQTLPPGAAISGTALAIAAGGLIGARRVAQTMSHGVTEMNPGQGLTANLVTAALVIGASKWGMPVSTTHVSCGSLFGLGTATGGARWSTIGRIMLAWVVTLPLAGALGALTATALQFYGLVLVGLYQAFPF
ncbi:MAG: anion permease [Myxococcota bacterium]